MEINSNIEPRLQTGCAQPYVAIPLRVTLNEWSKANALIPELLDWLSAKGIKTAGPLLYRYHTMGNHYEPFYLEVGFPVATAAKADGRIVTGHIPNGTFATLVHCGHPDMLKSSFNILQAWANTKGLKWQKHCNGEKEVLKGCFEFYMTNPADEPDLNKWRIATAILVEA